MLLSVLQPNFKAGANLNPRSRSGNTGREWRLAEGAEDLRLPGEGGDAQALPKFERLLERMQGLAC